MGGLLSTSGPNSNRHSTNVSSSSGDGSSSGLFSELLAPFRETNPSATTTSNRPIESVVVHIHEKSWKDHVAAGLLTALSLYGTYFLMKQVMKQTASSAISSKPRRDRLLPKNGSQDGDVENEDSQSQAMTVFLWIHQRYGYIPELSQYERVMLTNVVMPNAMPASFDDIGGLDEIKEEIFETVILPLQHPELFQGANRSSLRSPPRGVLLHGPPGTGKTMMAQAIAKECGCCFLNIRPSTLKGHFFGESNKMVSAIFSAAELLGPTIVFIDEIESFLGDRGANVWKNEASDSMMTEFLSLWDGLDSSKSTQIVVIGATNRPQDLDDAALRRFSRSFQIGLPNKTARLSIFECLLRHENIDSTVDFNWLAEETGGYSGADLKELCRFAAQLPVRELLHPKELSDDLEEANPGRNLEEEKHSAAAAAAAAASSTDPIDFAATSSFTSSSLDSSSNASFASSSSTASSSFVQRYTSTLSRNIELRPLRGQDFQIALQNIKSTISRQSRYRGGLRSNHDDLSSSSTTSSSSSSLSSSSSQSSPGASQTQAAALMAILHLIESQQRNLNRANH